MKQVFSLCKDDIQQNLILSALFHFLKIQSKVLYMNSLIKPLVAKPFPENIWPFVQDKLLQSIHPFL